MSINRSLIFLESVSFVYYTTYWSHHPTSLMDSPYFVDDEIAWFLTEAKKMLREAQMVAEAVPNVNIAAVDQAAHQLYGIWVVLHSVDDPFISRPELNGIIQDVADLMQFLEQLAERLATGPVPTPNIILTLQQRWP